MLKVGEFVAAAGLKALRNGVHHLGEAEVQHLHVLFWRDLRVRRFQIAMDDAFLVRGLERLADLVRELQCLLQW